MVFSHVQILKGYLLSIDEVFDLLKFLNGYLNGQNHYPYLKDIDNVYDLKDKKEWLLYYTDEVNREILRRFRGIQLYTPPCCSKENINTFVLGNCIKKYDRLDVKCEKCEKYTCCDGCLGETENGYYDANEIFSNFVEIDEDRICSWCNNDQKEKDAVCRFCRHHELEAAGMRLSPEQYPERRLNVWIKERRPKYYLSLDDCLSCT